MTSLHAIFIRPAVNHNGDTSHIPASQLTSLSYTGMTSTLARFSTRLHLQDSELAQDLDSKGLETTFYAFRWFTCLAPGGLGLPDTIRLWDSLFSDWCLERETPVDDDGFRFLEDFGIAVLLYVPLKILIRSHREILLEGGFSENITLLQRRPVDDLAKTLALAYTLRQDRITKPLNQENESSDPVTNLFKFGKDNETENPVEPRRTSTTTRWTRPFFKNNTSTQIDIPKTPPQIEFADLPSKFSPGAWGASLSAATKKLNKLRITPSPEVPSKSLLLSDRQTSISARVSAAGALVRESFERRTEIIQKVGEWVANDSGRNSTDEGLEYDSRANDEIRRLEGELRRRDKEEVTPEEYIARIKRRRDEREGKDVKGYVGDDPLGVAED